jgi:hypothetical protein
MNSLEAALALNMIEGTARLLSKVFCRFFVTIFGITATSLFQAYLFVRLFPSFV